MSENVKSVLRALDASPKQSLGQNFCTDPNILRKIVDAARIEPDAAVIEIGPGTGALTEFLAQTGCDLTAVEIDRRFENHLRERFKSASNVRFVFGDSVRLLPELLAEAKKPLIVVGNLPYNVSSQIIVALLENRTRVKRAVATLQLEMAKRLAGKPGTKDYGSLTVRLAAFAQVRLAFKIPPTCFFPAPKVHSGCVRIDFLESPEVSPKDESVFVKVVKAGFAGRRKQFHNTLGAAFGKQIALAAFEKAGIKPTVRPEMLNYREFISISDAVFELLQSNDPESH